MTRHTDSWSEQDESRLMDAVSDDPWTQGVVNPWRLIGDQVGRTSSACEKRFRKLCATMGKRAA